MDLGLKGKKIIVSGAAQGVGSAIFMALLKEGAHPIGIDKKALTNSELEEAIESQGLSSPVEFYEADITDESAIQGIYKKIGIVKGLVNNAGLLGGDQSHGGRTIEAWNKMMDNNAKSAFMLTEATIPKMTQGGSIVNIGSLELDMAAPNVILYTASKGALWGMTVAYSTTLADKDIRVNMVSPGNVNTRNNMAQYSAQADLIKGFEGRTPLKRSIEPEEVADTVLFLLSYRSEAITGQNQRIDCGYQRALWDPIWSKED
jgi:NAD(P)-dependent dehydrogenase (short-subunit alcohol dehydrogenase family)